MHWEGSLSREYPYLSASASLNAPLWIAKPWGCSSRAVSQLEAPFSLASFLARCNGLGNFSWTLAAACSSYSALSAISPRRWGITLWARSVCPWMISEISGDDRCRDVWCSLSAVMAGLMMSRPPLLAGSARSSLSVSPRAGLPVRAGMNVSRRMFSRG